MRAGPWNWLEIAKLIASLLIPATLAIFGIYIHRVTKKFDHLQWRNQKLIEKRMVIYDALAPLLNDVLCYFTYVGSWKEFEPQHIVALKRSLDKQIHLAAPLFSEAFFSSCMNFLNLCFDTYNGWNRDARLKTKWQRRKEARGNGWKDQWAECFSNSESDPEEIRRAYRAIMEAFTVDIGVHESFAIPDSGRVPANIR